MRIGITTFGADGNRSGIGQYIINLLAGLAEVGPRESCEVLAHRSERDVFAGPGTPFAVRTVSDRVRQPLLNVAWHQVALPAWCARRKYDVLFLPAANRRVPFKVPCPTVGTVHDFSALHVAGKYDAARTAYITRVLPRLVRGLTRVVTVSESSKHDIVRYAGVPEERVHVIHSAADARAFVPGDREASRRRMAAAHGIDGPYVLYVARIEHPGKNHVRLIEAFERAKSAASLPHKLVLAGSDWSGADEVHRAARASRVVRDIVFTGYVPGADLPDLYRGADLAVCPSLYEGFGMPVLEAMACGTAVACSNVSSLPEVAGDAAALFDPFDVDEMANTMRRILAAPAQRASLEARGLARNRLFSWRTSAARTLEVLRMAAAEGCA